MSDGKNTRTCKHPTCGPVCRRPVKKGLKRTPLKPSRKPLKRTRIKRQTKRIPKVSSGRKAENEIYFPEREAFLKEGDGKCELKTPVCLKEATCIHHTEGKVGADYLDKSKWMRSCHPCNNWVEQNSAKAKELGLKKANYKSKLTGVKKL